MSMPKVESLEERLFSACSQKNAEAVAECLKNGANMNVVCSSGRTCLGLVAEMGHIQILSLFLNNSTICKKHSHQTTKSNLGYFVVVHSESSESMSDIGSVEENKNKKFLAEGIDFDDFNDSLIQRFPGIPDRSNMFDEVLTPDEMDNLEWDVEITDNDESLETCNLDPWGSLYLWYANILSQTGSILAQVPPPDNVDVEDQFGCAALHYAAAEGHAIAIEMLISSGSKVNVEDSDNFTPLHLASAKSRVEIVKLLLSHGANPHHRSTDGITALHVCASRGLVENAEALVAAGASVNAVDISDRTPLYLAVSRRQHAVVRFLIDKGAKVNLEDIHGYTPLFEAVCSKDVELAQILLAAGAKVTQSHFLLHYAVLHRQEAMVKILVEAGSIINLRNEAGDTPLMLAVRIQTYSIVRLLLQHGAIVYYTNHVTRTTALQDAISYINRDCNQFGEMFSLFEEFGWCWWKEKNALCFAITSNNDHAVATLIRRWDIVSDENLPERSEMMNLLLLRDNKFLVELFVHAGFNLASFQPCEALFPLSSWFLSLTRNPLSLQNLARIAIRSCLKGGVYRKCLLLPLPPVLKSFVKLEEYRCPCQSISDILR